MMPRNPPSKICEHCGTPVLPHRKLSRKQWEETRFCSISCMRRQSLGDPAARFWATVDKSAGHGPWGNCWVWTGVRFEKGYGRFCSDGVIEQAHRRAYREECGPISDGLLVCHRCDNPPCVRPEHLFVGEVQDNTDDMIAKDRHTRGERSPSAKLTDEIVRSIRLSDESGAVLGRRYGVAKNTVLRVRRREIWRHV